MTPTRDPRRSVRRAPVRPAAARPTSRTEAPRRPVPTEAPPPTAVEHARLRRLVRGVLVGVIVVQAIALVLVMSPSARSQAVAVTNFFQVTGGTTLRGVNQNISSVFRTANGRLADLLRIAEEERRPYSGGNANMSEADLQEVTTIPLGRAEVSQGDSRAVTMDDERGVEYLTAMVPGTIPWDSYTSERRQSTDMALLTLRGGVQALHDFDESIRDDRRLEALSRASGNARSDRALQQIQIESSLEVARQLHALRAQQALQTNLYAVTESHRLGLEARQFAEDNATDCGIIGDAVGGETTGGAIALLLCGAPF